MVLYFFFASLSSQGVDVYDPQTGIISFHIEELVTVLTGLGGFIATFLGSRWAKKRGGAT